jgi:hypothetical protein
MEVKTNAPVRSDRKRDLLIETLPNSMMALLHPESTAAADTTNAEDY